MKKAFLFFVILAMVVVTFTSCSGSRNGYGCRGKESWNGMLRRINRAG